MTKTILGVTAAAILMGAGWYWYAGNEQENMVDDTFGTYVYSCDSGVSFEMTLFSSSPSVALKAQGSAPFTEVVLEQQSGPTYATEDGEVVLVGSGEKIQLTVGATTMMCDPVPNGDMAPFHWGGGGEGPDTD